MAYRRDTVNWFNSTTDCSIKSSCFFCLQEFNNDLPNNKKKTESLFVNNQFSLRHFSRFLKLFSDSGSEDDDDRLRKSPSDLKRKLSQFCDDSLVPICQDCSKMMKEFMDLYHVLEVTKLRLNWWVQNVHHVMTKARDGSVNSQEEDGSIVGSLRTEAIERTKVKGTCPLPRLVLRKIQAPKGSSFIHHQSEASETSGIPACSMNTNVSMKSPSPGHLDVSIKNLVKLIVSQGNGVQIRRQEATVESKTLKICEDRGAPKESPSTQALSHVHNCANVSMETTDTDTLATATTAPVPVEEHEPEMPESWPDIPISKFVKCSYCRAQFRCRDGDGRLSEEEVALRRHTVQYHCEVYFPNHRLDIVTDAQFKQIVSELLFKDFIGNESCPFCDEKFKLPMTPGDKNKIALISQIKSHLLKSHFSYFEKLLMEIQRKPELPTILKECNPVGHLCRCGVYVNNSYSKAQHDRFQCVLTKSKPTKKPLSKLRQFLSNFLPVSNHTNKVRCKLCGKELSRQPSNLQSHWYKRCSKKRENGGVLSSSSPRKSLTKEPLPRIISVSNKMNCKIRKPSRESIPPLPASSSCPYCRYKCRADQRAISIPRHLVRFHPQHYFPQVLGVGDTPDVILIQKVLQDILFPEFVPAVGLILSCKFCKRDFRGNGNYASNSKLRKHLIFSHKNEFADHIQLILKDPNLGERLALVNPVGVSCPCGMYLPNGQLHQRHHDKFQCNLKTKEPNRFVLTAKKLTPPSAPPIQILSNFLPVSNHTDKVRCKMCGKELSRHPSNLRSHLYTRCPKKHKTGGVISSSKKSLTKEPPRCITSASKALKPSGDNAEAQIESASLEGAMDMKLVPKKYAKSTYTTGLLIRRLKNKTGGGLQIRTCPYCRLRFSPGCTTAFTSHLVRFHPEHYFLDLREETPGEVVTKDQFQRVIHNILFPELLPIFKSNNCPLCEKNQHFQKPNALKKHLLCDHNNELKNRLRVILRAPNLSESLSAFQFHGRSCPCGMYIPVWKESTRMHHEKFHCKFKLKLQTVNPLSTHDDDDDDKSTASACIGIGGSKKDPRPSCKKEKCKTKATIALGSSTSNFPVPTSCPYCRYECSAEQAAASMPRHLLRFHPQYYFPHGEGLLTQDQIQRVLQDILLAELVPVDGFVVSCRFCGVKFKGQDSYTSNSKLRKHLVFAHQNQLTDQIECILQEPNWEERLATVNPEGVSCPCGMYLPNGLGQQQQRNHHFKFQCNVNAKEAEGNMTTTSSEIEDKADKRLSPSLLKKDLGGMQARKLPLNMKKKRRAPKKKSRGGESIFPLPASCPYCRYKCRASQAGTNMSRHLLRYHPQYFFPQVEYQALGVSLDQFDRVLRNIVFTDHAKVGGTNITSCGLCGKNFEGRNKHAINLKLQQHLVSLHRTQLTDQVHLILKDPNLGERLARLNRDGVACPPSTPWCIPQDNGDGESIFRLPSSCPYCRYKLSSKRPTCMGRHLARFHPQYYFPQVDYQLLNVSHDQFQRILQDVIFGEPEVGIMSCKFCGKKFEGEDNHAQDTKLRRHLVASHRAQLIDQIEVILREPNLEERLSTANSNGVSCPCGMYLPYGDRHRVKHHDHFQCKLIGSRRTEPEPKANCTPTFKRKSHSLSSCSSSQNQIAQVAAKYVRNKARRLKKSRPTKRIRKNHNTQQRTAFAISKVNEYDHRDCANERVQPPASLQKAPGESIPPLPTSCPYCRYERNADQTPASMKWHLFRFHPQFYFPHVDYKIFGVSQDQFQRVLHDIVFSNPVLEEAGKVSCTFCGKDFKGNDTTAKNSLRKHLVTTHQTRLTEQVHLILKDGNLKERLARLSPNGVSCPCGMYLPNGFNFRQNHHEKFQCNQKGTEAIGGGDGDGERRSTSNVKPEISTNSRINGNGTQIALEATIKSDSFQKLHSFRHVRKKKPVATLTLPTANVKIDCCSQVQLLECGIKKSEMPESESLTDIAISKFVKCSYCRAQFRNKRLSDGEVALRRHTLQYHCEVYFPNHRLDNIVTDAQFKKIVSELLFRDFIRKESCSFCDEKFKLPINSGDKNKMALISQIKSHLLKSHVSYFEKLLMEIQRNPDLPTILKECNPRGKLCRCGVYLNNLYSKARHERFQCVLTKPKQTKPKLKSLSKPKQFLSNFLPVSNHTDKVRCELCGKEISGHPSNLRSHLYNRCCPKKRKTGCVLSPSKKSLAKEPPRRVISASKKKNCKSLDGVGKNCTSETTEMVVEHPSSSTWMNVARSVPPPKKKRIIQSKSNGGKSIFPPPNSCPYCRYECTPRQASASMGKHLAWFHPQYYFPQLEYQVLGITQDQFQRVLQDILIKDLVSATGNDLSCSICGSTFKSRDRYTCISTLRRHILSIHRIELMDRLVNILEDPYLEEKLVTMNLDGVSCPCGVYLPKGVGFNQNHHVKFHCYLKDKEGPSSGKMETNVTSDIDRASQSQSICVQDSVENMERKFLYEEKYEFSEYVDVTNDVEEVEEQTDQSDPLQLES